MTTEPPLWRKNLPAVLATLCLAAAGGYAFNLMQMPLAWMMGAMVCTTAASLSGAPLKASPLARSFVIPVLGLMIGSAFTPDTVENISHWFLSMGLMIVYIVTVAVIAGTLFYQYLGVGPITAFFSATPGGLATMVIVGRDAGGDERTIALTHAVRVFLTVLIIPIWFRIFEGYQPGDVGALGFVRDLGLPDAGIMILTAILGIYGGRLIRLPSAQLLGPMILSAAVHMSGLTEAKPPVEIVNIAQVVIGASVGARFTGIALSHVFKVLLAAIGSTFFMVGLAAVIAFFVQSTAGLPFREVWLAFAPGGLAEMALISITLNIDPAFVSTHHLLRVVFMVLTAPLFFKLLKSQFHIEGDEPHRKFRDQR